jgi:hypothetical protein
VAPGLFPHSGGEFDQPRLGQNFAFEVGEQDPPRLLLVHETAGKDMAVAHAMLERNAPLPAGRMGRGPRKGIGRSGMGGRHGPGPVGRKPVAPVLPSGAQLLFDEQSAKTRAIDEQIAFDPIAVFKQ